MIILNTLRLMIFLATLKEDKNHISLILIILISDLLNFILSLWIEKKYHHLSSC